ncbi:MAG: hypothetical protein AAF681_09405 [Pseudomonadota bacterium]
MFIKFFAICVAVCIGVSAQAQNLGIQFASMPKGTQMIYGHSDGNQWVEVYMGKKGGYHIINRYKTTSVRGRPDRIMAFDASGRMVYYRAYGDRAQPYKVTYQPYSCSFVAGSCIQTEKPSGSGYVFLAGNRRLDVVTRKVKGRWTTVAKDKKGAGYAHVFTLGRYNLRAKIQWMSRTGLKTITLLSVR